MQIVSTIGSIGEERVYSAVCSDEGLEKVLSSEMAATKSLICYLNA